MQRLIAQHHFSPSLVVELRFCLRQKCVHLKCIITQPPLQLVVNEIVYYYYYYY